MTCRVWLIYRECKNVYGGFKRFMEARAADERLPREISNGEKIGARTACCTEA
jgi:hypothetical protein